MRPARLAGAVLPLALVGAALALVAPSGALADHSQLLLAVLVFLTALAIAPADLLALRGRVTLTVAASVAPLIALVPMAWALSRLFDGPVRDGTVALGLAPTEVAAAGLVAVAGGDAAWALAVVAGSLVASAVAGPLLVTALGGAEVDAAGLLGTFALVVLLPLAGGCAVRGALPRLGRAAGDLAGLASIVLALLVYAALSGTGTTHLAATLAAAAAFLALSGALALVASRVLRGTSPTGSALVFGLRDFAVAATLAQQAFGPRAAAVAGVYGVMMLVGGSALSTALRRSSAGRSGRAG